MKPDATTITGDQPMNEVKPLKKKTMTLNELQLRTLDVIRKARFQLGRSAHDNGMSDDEFIEQVLETLETEIYQDRHVLKMTARERSAGK